MATTRPQAPQRGRNGKQSSGTAKKSQKKDRAGSRGKGGIQQTKQLREGTSTRSKPSDPHRKFDRGRITHGGHKKGTLPSSKQGRGPRQQNEVASRENKANEETSGDQVQGSGHIAPSSPQRLDDGELDSSDPEFDADWSDEEQAKGEPEPKQPADSKVVGEHLRTVEEWAALGLSRILVRKLAKLGYMNPTRIQWDCIPKALEGRDVLGISETGSGKTLAFLLPCIERLLSSNHVRKRKIDPVKGTIRMSEARGMTKVLILLPTRELAKQCHSVLESLILPSNAHESDAKANAVRSDVVLPIRSCCLVGGESVAEQSLLMRTSPDIVCATPGRVLDMLLNSLSIHLDLLDVIVFDEADKLMDLGFKDECLSIIRRCSTSGGERQTLMFSATLSEQSKEFMKQALRETYTFVGAKPLCAHNLRHLFYAIPGQPENAKGEKKSGKGNSKIGKAEKQERTGDHQKKLPPQPAVREMGAPTMQQGSQKDRLIERVAGFMIVLQSYLKSGKKIICFFNTKRLVHTIALVFQMITIVRVPPFAELHGDMTHQQRVMSMQKFETGEVDILLATELASRGLDIPDVEVVINVEVPENEVKYIHRVGRVGRCGRSGLAVTIFDNQRERNLIRTLYKASTEKFNEQPFKPAHIDLKELQEMKKLVKECMPRVKEMEGLERTEKSVVLAETKAKALKNTLEHEGEILARPKKQWLLSRKKTHT